MTEAFQGGITRAAIEEVRSPGLGAGSGAGPAFELKFQLNQTEAQEVEGWVRQHLTPDPHGDHGSYHITSVYCDTPGLDVFHRSPGYRRCKFRLRRYGEAGCLYLECKRRWGDRVKKKRAAVAEEDLALLAKAPPPPEWAGAWFLRRIGKRGLSPACRVSYQRTAYFGQSEGAPIRLTFDRGLAGAAANGWDVLLQDGQPLLPGIVLLEMKFHVHMPDLFRGLMPRMPLQQGRVSKYRRCMEVCGLVREANGRAH